MMQRTGSSARRRLPHVVCGYERLSLRCRRRCQLERPPRYARMPPQPPGRHIPELPGDRRRQRLRGRRRGRDQAGVRGLRGGDRDRREPRFRRRRQRRYPQGAGRGRRIRALAEQRRRRGARLPRAAGRRRAGAAAPGCRLPQGLLPGPAGRHLLHGRRRQPLDGDRPPDRARRARPRPVREHRPARLRRRALHAHTGAGAAGGRIARRGLLPLLGRDRLVPARAGAGARLLLRTGVARLAPGGAVAGA